jgi:two-component system nitrogen regulation response regulator NtrX
MPLAMQAKLLRVLEESEVERIGGDKPITVDVRVVVATHRDLDQLAKQGGFRRDLYHRIYVFPIVLPALHERREDIPALVEHFARQLCAQNGWKPLRFAPEAIEALQQYRWPGNIRELRNVVERLLLLAEGEVDMSAVELALPNTKKSGGGVTRGPLAERVAGFERETVLAELERNHHHVTNTAKALGLERSHLYKKCQQLGIDLRQLE